MIDWNVELARRARRRRGRGAGRRGAAGTARRPDRLGRGAARRGFPRRGDVTGGARDDGHRRRRGGRRGGRRQRARRHRGADGVPGGRRSAYRQANLEHAAASVPNLVQATVLVGLLGVATLIVGLVRRQREGPARVGTETVVLLGLYLVGMPVIALA